MPLRVTGYVILHQSALQHRSQPAAAAERFMFYQKSINGFEESPTDPMQSNEENPRCHDHGEFNSSVALRGSTRPFNAVGVLHHDPPPCCSFLAKPTNGWKILVFLAGSSVSHRKHVPKGTTAHSWVALTPRPMTDHSEGSRCPAVMAAC